MVNTILDDLIISLIIYTAIDFVLFLAKNVHRTFPGKTFFYNVFSIELLFLVLDTALHFQELCGHMSDMFNEL